MLKWLTNRLRRFANLRQPPDWLYGALTGGGSTTSGVTVGADTALTLSSYFAAIRCISEDVAKLPLILYRRLEPRGKQREPKHPLYSLLHDAPNSEQTSMTFRESMMLHAIGWGNGFAEIQRDGRGMPIALWPLDPRRVTVERNKDTREMQYKVRSAPEYDETILQPKDVFHLHGLGFDGLTGYSVARLARESIGAALALEKSGAALFGRGSRPGLTLRLTKPKTPEALRQFREDWEKMYGGAERSWTTAILPPEIGEVTPLTIPNKDAQWIEARQFMVSELCRWLRIPPHKIAHLIDATYSNIGEQRLEYAVDTLSGWFTRWEQEIHRKLLPPKSPLFAEHLVDGLLRGEVKARYAAYKDAVEGGWMSRNEVRALENLNPVDGLDEFLMPLNTQVATLTE